MIYRIRIFCKPARRWDVWRAAMKIVQEGLRAAGLSIPYAQLDVHTGPQNMV